MFRSDEKSNSSNGVMAGAREPTDGRSPIVDAPAPTVPMDEPVHTLHAGEEVFYLHARDTPAAVFEHYAPFVQLWQDKRAGKRLPSWKDFSFEELTPWVGKMVLVDLIPGQVIDGTYRLCGGAWVKISNFDFTGKRYTEVIDDHVRAIMDPYHRLLIDEALIGRRTTRSYLEDRKDLYRIDMLEVVLSDDGETATQYLAFAHIHDKSPIGRF